MYFYSLAFAYQFVDCLFICVYFVIIEVLFIYSLQHFGQQVLFLKCFINKDYLFSNGQSMYKADQLT